VTVKPSAVSRRDRFFAIAMSSSTKKICFMLLSS
jgi:hypothetical protein